MSNSWRLNLLLFFFLAVAIMIGARLWYWQVGSSSEMKEAASNQRWVSFEIAAKRGEIKASDNYPLVGNDEAYLLYASLPELELPKEKISRELALVLGVEEKIIYEQLNRQKVVWVPVLHKVARVQKEEIEALKIKGLGFENEAVRSYPEASGAAHLLGFVGSDLDGKDKGYFGLEGYYDLELRGKSGYRRWEKDAAGKPILVGEAKEEDQKNGRTLVTTIDRTVQYLIENKLKEGIEKYGAKSGTISVMDPFTGAILGMASWPVYEPFHYWDFDKSVFKNPVISSAYEPGSTFKVVMMAAALNAGAVDENTRCDKCSGPRTISDYTIKTSLNKYWPDSTLTEIIEHSDNVGMVFVSEKLGLDKAYDYLEKFGLGQSTGVDLQEESVPAIRPKNDWRPIDLATASFGQGIALTPLQMLRAVAVIANQGKMVKPYIVQKVIDDSKVTEIKPKPGVQIIKPSTANYVTQMMVGAVDVGEAKLAALRGFKIAGKTGTAQIPIQGHYDEEKTVASFVGFAPASKPKFIMLITLTEPSASIWGSSTAAPLWLEIAKELITYFGILPG